MKKATDNALLQLKNTLKTNSYYSNTKHILYAVDFSIFHTGKVKKSFIKSGFIRSMLMTNKTLLEYSTLVYCNQPFVLHVELSFQSRIKTKVLKGDATLNNCILSFQIHTDGKQIVVVKEDNQPIKTAEKKKAKKQRLHGSIIPFSPTDSSINQTSLQGNRPDWVIVDEYMKEEELKDRKIQKDSIHFMASERLKDQIKQFHHASNYGMSKEDFIALREGSFDVEFPNKEVGEEK